MNFRLRPDRSVILMSRRANVPYRDRIDENGSVLIYEGHDVPRTPRTNDPKSLDQPRVTSAGKLTQNGLFEKAALDWRNGTTRPEVVAVYEKIQNGIWAFNGLFLLTDATQEADGKRLVFEFRLELSETQAGIPTESDYDFDHTRVIPSAVKLEVWKRDKGRCVICNARDNLHFDHDLPFSKGGTSLTTANIRILCARHNLSKKDKIE